MRLLFCIFSLIVCCTSHAKDVPKPLTHIDACKNFSRPVVRIDTADGRGTGFIVAPDGWIITAAHVVIDKATGQYYRAISVVMPNEWDELAVPVLDITEAAVHDFALLKINRTALPSLKLGDETAVDIGSDLSIIGFPFSALDEKGGRVNVKFCLTATSAANASFAIGKSQVNLIYFQGPSVKGISGAPIISHKTGKVIGVVNTKLTGIGKSLQDLRDQIAHGVGGGIVISGLVPGPAVGSIIDVLDLQLANGLGSGTGAADAAFAVRKAQRHYKGGARH